MDKFQIKLHYSLIELKCFSFISHKHKLQNDIFFYVINHILINVGIQNMYKLYDN